ncbi:MAG: hypothetical protein AAFW60_01880 [Pseudomonadota bacterium]
MAEQKPKALLMETGGQFYAYQCNQGWAVYKDGGTRHFSDGSKTLGLNFPVLVIHECVNQDAAEEICVRTAKAMNEAELFQ